MYVVYVYHLYSFMDNIYRIIFEYRSHCRLKNNQRGLSHDFSFLDEGMGGAVGAVVGQGAGRRLLCDIDMACGKALGCPTPDSIHSALFKRSKGSK